MRLNRHMTTAERLYTVEEFASPEPIEGGKMELVDGSVVLRPANRTPFGTALGPVVPRHRELRRR